MPVITLDHANRAQVHGLLTDSTWAVVCLCAAWCDVCTAFRSSFDTLAERHPDKLLLWIDIEDEADVVGDFDVENFPTLMILRGDDLAFYGTVEADGGSVHRLIAAQTRDLPAVGSASDSVVIGLRARLAATS